MQATPARKPCQSLDEVRANIDRLDRLIVPLLAERETYVREAARFKPSAEAVVVPARVEQVVARVTELAREAGAAPAAMERIYRTIIDAMTELEVAEHHRLHKDSART
jgi:isochorismate pyruvate lyase